VNVVDIEAVKAPRAPCTRAPLPWAAGEDRDGQADRRPAAERPAAKETVYDHLARAYHATPPDPDPARLRDTKFTNGLNIVLDGLARRLPGAGSRP